MVKYITYYKEQTINFGFGTDLSGEVGTFTMSKNSSTILTKTLTAIDASAGTFYMDLTTSDTDEDLGIYDYNVTFDGSGEVETGEVYLIENETKRVTDIKTVYGLGFDTTTITKAFNNAKKSTINFLYSDGSSKSKEYTTDNNIINIDNYVADNQNYGFVCKDSVRVYEYTKTSPYSVTELNDNINSITFDYPNGKTFITMDDDYPSSSNTLKVEYKKISKSFSEIYDKIKYVQELYTYLYLLDHTEINKLQYGFTTKTINNVSFTYDKDSIDDLKIKIRQWIDNEAIDFQEILLNDVTINNDY